MIYHCILEYLVPCALRVDIFFENTGRVISFLSDFSDCRFPGQNPGRSRTNCGFGVWGRVCGAIFIINFIAQRIGQTLRRIILLHLGLVTFRIHFRKIRKPFIFMVFGPSGRDHDSQNQLYLILGTPRYFNKSEKHTSSLLQIIILGNIKSFENEHLGN